MFAVWGKVSLNGKSGNGMARSIQNGARKAQEPVAGKAAARSAHAMNPECLALIENFRLMDDTFMSKCFENAPECVELSLRIILGKEDLEVVSSQTEYPVKNLQGRGVRFDVFARDSDGREYDIEIRNAADMYFDILRKRVSELKDSEEGRLIMCKAVEEYAERRAAESKAEGIAEGESRGKREGKRETMLATAMRMLKSGMLALKDVARFSGLSLEQVKKLQASR